MILAGFLLVLVAVVLLVTRWGRTTYLPAVLGIVGVVLLAVGLFGGAS